MSEDNEETVLVPQQKQKALPTHSSKVGIQFVSFIKPFQTVPASDTSAKSGISASMKPAD